MTEDSELGSIEISKSQRKREAHALQTLGARLTELKTEQLAALPITESALAAIQDYQNLPNSHGARKRQLQYIGKMMRECDFQEVSDAVEKLLSPHFAAASQQSTKAAASAEDLWIGKLLREGDVAINELLSLNPSLERQQLRQLVRNLCNAQAANTQQHEARLKQFLSLCDLGGAGK